ncbi:MAG TPA: efflux RND transporter periplasmic adaptor subunit [Verrucomicrobiae bacterium]|nr:efflux RND transporter periplasmic adaptor subunit [Verrucomicrobiae bacterium]
MNNAETMLRGALAPTAALVLVAALAACGADASPQSKPTAPPVSVAEVVTQDLAEWDEFTGRLEAQDKVELRPRVAGYVEAVEFFEGTRVQKGQVLFRIDPRPFRAEVDRLDAELQRAQAQHQLARSDHQRAQRLVEQDALSREEFERREAAERAAAAQVAAVNAALAAARLNLEFTRVTAPIAGRVGAALVTEGNLVDSRSLLTTVVSIDPIYVNFDADESVYLRHVREPDAVQRARSSDVRVGLADEQGYPHVGRFFFVDNEVNPGTGTIRVRASLPNPDGRLTAGLFARVRVAAGELRSAVLIDERAVGTDLGHKFVLALKPDNTVEYRAVTLGPVVDGLRVVRDGLRAGDVIVVNGLQRARPGGAVTPQKVAMNGTSDAVVARTE